MELVHFPTIARRPRNPTADVCVSLIDETSSRRIAVMLKLLLFVTPPLAFFLTIRYLERDGDKAVKKSERLADRREARRSKL
jgi:hypothetical protein